MISVTMPTSSIVIEVPKFMSMSCPFCNCEKEIRYNSFDTETGKTESKTMTASSFQTVILNNYAQPLLREFNKPSECYCPQCFVSFSIYKALGMF